jgi:hypothetical protein
MGADDGLEAFGGNWSGKHIVITGALDDSFDADQGFTGSLQYVFLHQEPAGGNYGSSGRTRRTTSTRARVRKPVVSNVTFIGTATNDPPGDDQEHGASSSRRAARRDPQRDLLVLVQRRRSSSPKRPPRSLPTPARSPSPTTILFKNSVADGGASPYPAATARPGTSRASSRTPATATRSTSTRSSAATPGARLTSSPPPTRRRSATGARSTALRRPTTSAPSRTLPATGPPAGPTTPRTEPHARQGWPPPRRRARTPVRVRRGRDPCTDRRRGPGPAAGRTEQPRRASARRWSTGSTPATPRP